jgi:hypothetical protein
MRGSIPEAGFPRVQRQSDLRNSDIASWSFVASFRNTGNILLGMLIEKVSGRPYADYLDEEILRPLALTAKHQRSGPSLEFTL